MEGAQKLVARIEEGDHVLYYKEGDGSLHPLLNSQKFIVPVRDEGMSQKLSQIFPGVRLAPGSRFVIVSLDL